MAMAFKIQTTSTAIKASTKIKALTKIKASTKIKVLGNNRLDLFDANKLSI
jgi:hypothetical protein